MSPRRATTMLRWVPGATGPLNHLSRNIYIYLYIYIYHLQRVSRKNQLASQRGAAPLPHPVSIPNIFAWFKRERAGTVSCQRRKLVLEGTSANRPHQTSLPGPTSGGPAQRQLSGVGKSARDGTIQLTAIITKATSLQPDARSGNTLRTSDGSGGAL